MYNILISREIPRIAYDLFTKEGFAIRTLKENENLTSLDKSYLKSIDAIITMLFDHINLDFLAKCENLKVISNYAVGVNNLDLNELQNKKILIGHTPEVLTEATAELTLTLLLNATRNIPKASSSLYSGTWKGFSPLDFLGPTLFHKNISIFGLGRIGKKVAEILHYGFGCKISTLDRGSEANNKVLSKLNFPLEIKNENQFLSDCDFLILTAPLNPSTKEWLNEKRIHMIKKNCVIVNSGRGGLINETDLIVALKENSHLVYASDVFNTEPLPLDHPFIHQENAILFPHLGSATIEARSKMAEICAINIIMGLKEKKVLYSPV